MNGKRLAFFLTLLALLLAAGGLLMAFWNARWLAAAETVPLQETAEQLDNPDRGFYELHGFVLADEMDVDEEIRDHFFRTRNGERALALLELNLRNYAAEAITPAALANLSALFDGLRTTGLHYIVRFVYDWDGRNMETEPARREIIQQHMEQTAPVLNANADLIYTLQGLYIGNWGEMNGTRYTEAEHLRALAATLAEATDPSIPLSVRTPAMLRTICGQAESEAAAPDIRQRMGLFNDGMLGSSLDLGTYGDRPRAEAAYAAPWRRADELAFQELLCRTVPNGGEAVMSETGCSLEDALDYLRTIHVSYLNEYHDRRLLDSWAAETVEGGPWDGADGLSYIKAHLGYRFTASDPAVQYSFLTNRLTVAVDIRNVGFAPAYFQLRPCLVLLDLNGQARYSFPLSGDLNALWGGHHTEPCTLRGELSLSDVEPGDYRLALRLESGLGTIRMANAGSTEAGELLIGGIHGK